MIRPDDLEWCRNAIREGSYSFHAASKLLPVDVRDAALALYAFCRVADDEVDFGVNKPAATRLIPAKERIVSTIASHRAPITIRPAPIS
jgi:phytoene synthase